MNFWWDIFWCARSELLLVFEGVPFRNKQERRAKVNYFKLFYLLALLVVIYDDIVWFQVCMYYTKSSKQI